MIWLLVYCLSCSAQHVAAEGVTTGSPLIPLTQEERDWLGNHPVIRLAPDPGFPPIEFIDDAGRYNGIAADYVALVEKNLGIRFTIVHFKNWEEVLEAAKNRSVDMLGAVSASEQRAGFLAFNHPYLELPGHIITNQNNTSAVSLDRLKGKKVAVVSGSIWQEFLERDFPEIELELVADATAGLNKVSFGTVDAMMVNRAVATHYTQKLSLTNLRVAGETDYYASYAFATRNDWPELNRILEKALLLIKPDTRSAILDKWIATNQINAQSPIPSVKTPSSILPGVEEIKAKIEELDKDSQLAKATRDQALELYRLILSRLEAAKLFREKAAKYDKSLDSAPAATARIRKETEIGIASGEPALDDTIPSGVSREQLQRRMDQEQAKLDDIRKTREELLERIKAQQGRPSKIQQAIAEIKLSLDRIQWQLAASTPPGEDPLIVEARRLSLIARKNAHAARITMLERELISYDTRLELLIAQHNRAQLLLSRAEAQIKRLQARLNVLLADEADDAKQAAIQNLQEVFGKHPILQDAAERNAELSEELSTITVWITEITDKRNTVRKQLTELNRDLQSIEQQLKIAGQSAALAEVLISQRRKLPNLNIYDRSVRERQSQITNARLREFQLNEQRRHSRAVEKDPYAPLAESLGTDLSGEQRTELNTQLQQLTTDRSELRNKLANAYSTYAKHLTTLNLDEQRLTDVVQGLKSLLDERLLWTATTSPVGPEWIEDSARAGKWSFSLENWKLMGWDLVRELGNAPLLSLGVFLVIFALLALRGYFRRREQTIAEHIGNPYRDSFVLTLELLLITVLWVIPVPLLMGFLAWLLRSSLEVTHFSAAVGHGLTRLTISFFFLEFYRRISQEQGLAQIHFKWSDQACEVLHHNLSWLRFFIYPTSFMLGLVELQPAELVDDAPGRGVFLIELLVLTVFFSRLMHPRRGVFGVALGERRQGWPWRLRYIWYPLAIAWPLALVGLTLYGYYYTATHLFFQIGYSFWSIVGVIVFYHLMLRWAMIAKQRLALARTLAASKAAKKAKAAHEAGEAAGEGVPDSLEPPESTVAKISEQTRALLRAVAAVILVILIWNMGADTAPLFDQLDQITLWHNAMVIDGVESLKPVTLWDLSLSAVALGLTLIAVQNLPGFLEISFLRQISLSRGALYAITTISRYVIIAVGVIIASNMIGLGWSKVQWLLAGLTVGLGFGLQEIFANFISGLILLFERPIRIGDTVTVGNTTGTVTRIRTRATTITDWDLKELIIPNKSFVTGDVVNWTLTDPVTRLIIRVGVARGSDIELTEKLMYDIARANPLVLKDPMPLVFFCGFGDSALTFELRVFFKDILHKMPLTHELNKAINKAFAEQGIEIAFPQRDLHIRSVDSLVKLHDRV